MLLFTQIIEQSIEYLMPGCRRGRNKLFSPSPSNLLRYLFAFLAAASSNVLSISSWRLRISDVRAGSWPDSSSWKSIRCREASAFKIFRPCAVDFLDGGATDVPFLGRSNNKIAFLFYLFYSYRLADSKNFFGLKTRPLLSKIKLLLYNRFNFY